MSTGWFVFPVGQEAAFRVLFNGKRVRGRDNPDNDEQVGSPRLNAAGDTMFVASSRVTSEKRGEFTAAKPAWLEIRTSGPPTGDWVQPIGGGQT